MKNRRTFALLFTALAVLSVPSLADTGGQARQVPAWQSSESVKLRPQAVPDFRASLRKPILPKGVIPAPPVKFPRNEKIRIAEPHVIKVVQPVVKPVPHAVVPASSRQGLRN